MAADGPREEIRLLVLSDVKLHAADEREAERERTSENVLATPVVQHQRAMQMQMQTQMQRRPSIATSVAASVDSEGPFFESPRRRSIAQHRASVGGSVPHASSVPSGLSGLHRLSFEGVSSTATPLRSSMAHRLSVPSTSNRSPVVERAREETDGDGEGAPDGTTPQRRSADKGKGRRVSLAVMQGQHLDETMQLPQPPSFAVRQVGLGDSRRGVRGRAGKPLQRRASFRAVNETYTPLHLAAVQGDIEQVTMLVDSGFDIETTVKDGR
jgi:hypothetical protein